MESAAGADEPLAELSLLLPCAEDALVPVSLLTDESAAEDEADVVVESLVVEADEVAADSIVDALVVDWLDEASAVAPPPTLSDAEAVPVVEPPVDWVVAVPVVVESVLALKKVFASLTAIASQLKLISAGASLLSLITKPPTLERVTRY